MTRRRRAKKPPPGLRPKLTRSQIASVQMVHTENLHAIADGRATQQTLYDHHHAVLVWLTLAKDYRERYGDSLDEAVRVMEAELAASTAMVERWRRTGRVLFTGPELQMARESMAYMDALAELVDACDADAAGRAAIKAITESVPDLVVVEVPA